VVQDMVRAKKDAITAGTAKVFTGPISDQSGKVRIPAGESATDEALLGMDWFVQGVVGTTE
jgi:basic membrane protein A